MATLMTPAGQREALAALLATMPAVGIVHQRRRTIRDEQGVRKLLVPSGDRTGRVNAWMIYPSPATTTVSERQPGFFGKGVKGGGVVMTTMQWSIDAYYQLDDEAGSEETFFDLVWSVADEINSYGQLAIDGLVHQLPADVDQFGFVMLAGSFLYHYAKIDIGFQGKTRG